jgi:outer membrane protein OmpA-like peptidoglycan-associated protein
MKTALSRVVCTVGLIGVSVAAMAGESKTAPPQEPIGFVAGGVIGGLAGGPFGAVIGAGIGTWLGNRVHRAGEAARAEAQVAALQTDKSALQGENTALLTEKSELSDTNQALSAQMDELSKRVQAVQAAKDGGDEAVAAEVLNGLQGDVLFRTGSAEVTSEMAQQIQVLAQAVAKSPELKVRLDGFADPRGTVDLNQKLSEERANAVRDLFLAGGVTPEALEVNAYGKSQSVAEDADGYALERRVRLTLEAERGDSDVARVGANN